MTTKYDPRVGDWYQNPQGARFEVVAFDAPGGNVEIQYYDGMVEELDMDAWEELDIEAVEPPEDWSGSLDIEREDYGVDLGESSHDEERNYLEDVDRME